jgi:hypothetical protein
MIYEEIYQAIKLNNIENVRILLFSVDTRKAFLFCEMVKSDMQASELIKKIRRCRCGKLAVRYYPESKCPQCIFNEGLSRIEYSK